MGEIMKKKLLLCTASLIFMLSGCTGQSEEVTVEIPAGLTSEEKTQVDYDLMAKEEKWESITLNEDGSLTYVMTKDKHDKLIEETVESYKESMDEMIGSEDYPNFLEIDVNENYTEFTVTIKGEELTMEESFSTLGFYMMSGMYHILNDTTVDNCKGIQNEYKSTRWDMHTVFDSNLLLHLPSLVFCCCISHILDCLGH